MKFSKKFIKTFVLGLFILSSCSEKQVNTNKDIQKENISKTRNLIIKGKVDFGNIEKSKGFKIKNTSLIAERATISIIYPADHADINLRNTTNATGLCDIQGNFIINTDQNFSPENSNIMILEASKRIGGAGNSLISLRTIIKWKGNEWESISSPDIIINKQTTALSIISSLSPNIMNSAESMNKVAYVNGVGNVIFDAKLTPSRFNAVYREVENFVSDFKDPVENIIRLSTYTGAVNYDLYSANLKSNMHTLQTVAETYAVDWGGVYPSSVETLKNEASSKNYWRVFKNPFSFTNQVTLNLPVSMNKADYEQAKLTLNYKGIILSDMSQLKGIVLYQGSNINPFISYSIYGVNINGDYLKVDDRDTSSQIYFLTNN